MNKHLIYQEDAIKLLDDLENHIAEEEGWQEKCDGVFQAKELIINMASIEAEPVRHGQWIPAEFEKSFGLLRGVKCSLCGEEKVGKIPNYCPNCGAKMERENCDE